jgi:hypothetical protein
VRSEGGSSANRSSDPEEKRRRIKIKISSSPFLEGKYAPEQLAHELAEIDALLRDEVERKLAAVPAGGLAVFRIRKWQK